ncbi:uncharacterized protein BDZ83DRAFT_167334 [Colletotrichum acutatum]|uniref:Uncharacterized protein n=1 Tax=Glomerella acutata TaxID=27357 RepID=A0AAD9D3G7_GLOAC|nr:uncharacterized protein BDZ83DRAFT_167334 [Colletotrichum acutatum]KAK1731634.1 hypothetical protein BDZ83DRAFT_167334 [Colletotrichum acutatum]
MVVVVVVVVGTQSLSLHRISMSRASLANSIKKRSSACSERWTGIKLHHDQDRFDIGPQSNRAEPKEEQTRRTLLSRVGHDGLIPSHGFGDSLTLRRRSCQSATALSRKA